jgi:hypothetical protein
MKLCCRHPLSLVVLLLALGLVAQVFARDQTRPPTQRLTRGSRPAKGPRVCAAGKLRTVEATGGAQLVVKRFGRGRALAPADWQLLTSPQGNAVDLSSPDRQVYAGWGMVAITRSMQPYYGDLYGDPATSMRFLITQQLEAMGDTSSVRYTSQPRPLDRHRYFTQRSFESAGHRGIVFYRLYPANTGSPQDYIESVYLAITAKRLWARKGALAVNVASSIRGRVTFKRSPTGGALPPGRKDPDAPDLSTYNKELGTEYCHSPSTGENFYVSHADSWNENGPDGPGYYKQDGNTHEKLELGRSD